MLVRRAGRDTFFAQYWLADPAWSARYGIKFRFAPLPWGMAVAHDNTTQFATLLNDLSIAFHIDGSFLALAKANQLDLAFLADQHAKWTGPWLHHRGWRTCGELASDHQSTPPRRPIPRRSHRMRRGWSGLWRAGSA